MPFTAGNWLLSAAADSRNNFDHEEGTCSPTAKYGSGTSMATPVVAGAAAMMRQYFAEGFYPTGVITRASVCVGGGLVRVFIISSALT